MDKDLKEMQGLVGSWSKQNFGDQVSKANGMTLGSLAPLLGVVEEVGELCHATLKHHQGIRGFDDPAKYEEAVIDAAADIMVYLCDYAEREGFSLHDALNTVWDRIVSKRNWAASPQSGAAV